MVYNTEIENILAPLMVDWENLQIKKMFWGVGYLLDGHMAVGINQNYIILRLGVDDAKEVLRLPKSKPFDITGKPLQGWVMIEPTGFMSPKDMVYWLNKAKNHVLQLPPK